MATDKEYLNFILEQLSEVEGITYRAMMGEYIFYMYDKVVAYLCDDRLLVRLVTSAVRLMPNAVYEPPYNGATNMILVDNVDDKDFLKILFNAIYPELPTSKKRKK